MIKICWQALRRESLFFKSLQNEIKIRNQYSNKRCYSVVTINAQNSSDLKEGSNIEGFVVSRVSHIPEFYLTSIELEHENTGASYLHLARGDSNNAFSVGFRTTPFDSTGVPHILEHLCICGSHKYPVRDPYFKMLSRSMATFMNAMTGSDYTIYPFSTQNKRDYMNLLSVYMDAVYRPLLRETDFSQEGWRFEYKNLDDPTSEIVLKGVVLNEMKGVFSDNQNIFYQSLLNQLLPSHTYGVVSGGNPKDIPTLTYEALKDFHKKHYHPSNTKFYSYGNFPLKDTLKFINSCYLVNYSKEDSYWNDTIVPLEPKWSSAKKSHITCRNDKMADPEKQSTIAVAHICSDVCDVYESFVMNFVSELLISGPNSPLYKALLEPNVGSGFGPMTGYLNHVRSTFFSASLQGLHPKDFDWFVDTFDSTIKNVISKGFEDKNIEGVLHNIELSIKHQTTDFGLSVLFAINTPWVHNADIVQSLKVNDQVNRLKNDMKNNPKFLQDIVAKYLLDNPHRLVLTMSPVEDYDEKIIIQEKELIDQKLSILTDSDKKTIYEKGLQLRELQKKTEDISCLPTLKISDLKKDIEKEEISDVNAGGVPAQLCLQPTNGLAYFYGLLGLEKLSDEEKDIIPLFCYIADKMGTSKTDYKKFDQEVNLVTQGLNFSYQNSESLKDLNSFKENILISSHCLNRNGRKMFQIWSELFNNLNGPALENKDRFQTLVSSLASNYLNSIPNSGHHYAMLSSASLVNFSAKRKEVCGGLTFVKKLQEISQQSKIDETLNIIKNIASSVFNKESLKTALNVSPDVKDELFNDLISFCDSINGNKNSVIDNTPPIDSISNIGIHHILPMQVNFAAKSIVTAPYISGDFAALRVLCRLLTLKYLLPEIREKGGAYGAGVNISSGGVMSFYSYRDPNPVDTLDIFDGTYDWIFNNKISQQDLEEAILGTFQSVDAPIPPSQIGMKRFLNDLDHETFQKHRLALMKINQDDLYKVASKYLINDGSRSQGRTLIGPENSALIASREGESWTVIN